MTSIKDNEILQNDDESFIILGTSPGTSLDVECNGQDTTESLTKVQIEEALKDFPAEASMAYKAQFNLGECPSVASMMVASTIMTDDKTTEDLQKSFGELIDENILLKETLKQNNVSMKQQFLLIAECQEDMMKTHVLHKEKFDETRMLVEKLRHENKKLKQDIVRLTDMDSTSLQSKSTESNKSAPLSAVEFVTSPDDDVINKLTAQLELVEKQRRQVIMENEKLTWQKESLEKILDATSKERDELKDKLEYVQLQFERLDNESAQQVKTLKSEIQDLKINLQQLNSKSVSSDEVSKRDDLINQLENKISILQNDLKTSQLKILELENVKLEFSKYKSGVSDTVKMYKDQIQNMNCRLREAQTTVFQPVRFSVTPEGDTTTEYAKLSTNLKIYDKTLKHLSDMLNGLINGTSDCLVQLLGSVASLLEYKLEKNTVENFKQTLTELKNTVEKQHASALSNIANVRGTMTVLNDIFKDYNQVLDTVNKQKQVSQPANVQALTAALVARGEEIQNYEQQVKKLREHNDETDVLKAQLELYKSDFEAERQAREKMASDKDAILADLRSTQRRNQELVLQVSISYHQLEEVRKRDPTLHRAATTKKFEIPPAAAGSVQGNTTGNMVRKKKKISKEIKEDTPLLNGDSSPPPLRYVCPVCDKSFKTLILLQQHVYTCPKCMKFSSHMYKVMEDHFDDCLDDF